MTDFSNEDFFKDFEAKTVDKPINKPIDKMWLSLRLLAAALSCVVAAYLIIQLFQHFGVI